MCRYDNSEDNLTEASQILCHASKEKENFPCQLNSVMLGKIINEIWGEKVKLVRRGPRKQRKSFYQNLKVKTDMKSPQETLSELMTNADKLKLKDGWSIVCEDNKVSFIRLESWSFRNQRGSTEVRIEKSSTNLEYSIISHGCEYPLAKLMDMPALETHPFRERVKLILDFIECSKLCSGTNLDDEEPVTTLLPHVSGEYRDNESELLKVFSERCSIIQCSDGICCVNCRKIKLLTDRSKRRKLSRDGIHPFTNKRFMTRDELTIQLCEETRARQKAEKRESYWKDKFFAHCLEMDKEDHEDLSKMFLNAHNVPREMADL